MSELLSAAAAALGLPEDLAQRSAEARAAETGASVDDVLAAWAGGAPAQAGQPGTDAGTAVAGTPGPSAAPQTEAPSPPIEIRMPAAPVEAPQPVPAGPYEPPVLIGVRDNPLVVLLSAIGVFIVIVLIGLVGPASQADEAGARSSEIPYTGDALAGQEIYASLGCSSCHTQMVRPVVADVGLGGVTLNDSNQILGTRRFGPDLSDVGTRLSGGQIEALVGGFGGHPAHSLSEGDLSRLVAYLTQSQTAGRG